MARGLDKDKKGKGAAPAFASRRRQTGGMGIAVSAPGCYTAVAFWREKGALHWQSWEFANDEEPLPQELLRWAKELRVSLALPRAEVIVHQVAAPSTAPEQVEKLARHEGLLRLPWPEDESLLGCQIKGATEEGYTNLALFLSRRETVERHAAVLRRKGLRAARVEPSAAALERLFAQEGSPQAAALGLVSPGGCEYARFYEGRHVFSRGSQDAAAPLALFEDSLALDHKRNNPLPPLPLFLAGADASILEEARTRFAQTEVLPIDALPALPLNGSACPTAAELLGLAAALGAAEADDGVNLLPPADREWFLRRRLARTAGRAALQVGWFVLLAVGLAYGGYTYDAVRAAQAQQDIARLKTEVGDLQMKSDALHLLVDERAQVSAPLRIILELYERTPTDIGITSLQYDASGALVFGGEAPSFEAVYSYMNVLSASAVFQAPELKQTVRPRGQTKPLVEFRIACTLADPA